MAPIYSGDEIKFLFPDISLSTLFKSGEIDGAPMDLSSCREICAILPTWWGNASAIRGWGYCRLRKFPHPGNLFSLRDDKFFDKMMMMGIVCLSFWLLIQKCTRRSFTQNWSLALGPQKKSNKDRAVPPFLFAVNNGVEAPASPNWLCSEKF